MPKLDKNRLQEGVYRVVMTSLEEQERLEKRIAPDEAHLLMNLSKMMSYDEANKLYEQIVAILAREPRQEENKISDGDQDIEELFKDI